MHSAHGAYEQVEWLDRTPANPLKKFEDYRYQGTIENHPLSFLRRTASLLLLQKPETRPISTASDEMPHS
jgi:hypothetical protein